MSASTAVEVVMPQKARLRFMFLTLMVAVMAFSLSAIFAQQISMTPAGPAPDPYPPNPYHLDESLKLEMPRGITTL